MSLPVVSLHTRAHTKLFNYLVTHFNSELLPGRDGVNKETSSPAAIAAGDYLGRSGRTAKSRPFRSWLG